MKTVSAQIVQPEMITPLPAAIQESSGIETIHSNNIWTHNDSGDSARIYNIDTLGNILRTVFFDVDEAIDCEESTRDADGNYYLGDFGNNANDRTNLRIYKIPDPDTLAIDTIIPQLITFHYADQTLFPPNSVDMNFDCEAMFHFQDSLYLFSKNRGTSTFCKMYRLPDQPGDYIAELVDSFNTGTWITSADISPSGKNMVLLSESRIWLFTNISEKNFFGSDVQMISMYTTQKEAVVFVNDSLLYISDEYFMGFGGNLYQLGLSSWINGLSAFSESPELKIYPNPVCNLIFIYAPEKYENFIIHIFDASGKTLRTCENCSILDVSSLRNGHYFIKFFSENKCLFGCFEKF